MEPTMGSGMGAAMGGLVFALVWLLMMVVMFGAWIFVLIAIWRGMKAHESIAQSLRQIANRQP